MAAGLAERCEIALAFATGVPFTGSITVETVDLTPTGIVKPIFQATSNYGHFGRNGFSWEQADRIEVLKKAVR